MRKIAILAVGVAALVAAPVAKGDYATASKRRANAAPAKAFRSCTGLVRYARRHALRTIEPRRLVSPVPLGSPLTVPVAAPERGAPDAPAATQPQPLLDHSPTNVQEAGVDEPDIVKTDGSRIFAIAAGKLHAVDVTGKGPRLAGSLALEGSDHQLLLDRDRLLVISTSYPEIVPLPGIEPGPPVVRATSILPFESKTVLSEVDVSDPASMRIVRTLTVDGTYVSSRLNGRTARVVIASWPRALEPLPAAGAAAQGRNETRRQLRRAPRSRWLPSYVLERKRTGKSTTRSLVRCRAVRRAQSFSGLDLLTVLTIDLAKGLPPVDTDGLMSDAQIVYASARNLYVATQRWVQPELVQRLVGQTSTAIHKFAADETDSTVYRASGEVPGFLLNQFSLSEHRGFLRVASTEEPSWLESPGGRGSESFVTVLDEQSGALATVGRVGGIGHGERIYSVRFIDDVGFVVTFRQTDPLYTVDLSTPTKPSVLGELQILGYSAYLHPVGGDLLIGVGQDATPQGRTLGTQLSLFDVSDLHRPARLHRRAIGYGSSSEVEYDHHAFLYWPASGLAVLPLQAYARDRGTQEFAGAIGFRIGRSSGIEEAGRITHPGQPVRRALVVGNRLYTVSEGGVEASSLDTLAELAWAPFG
jgi:uncharacterized secreted protein with C-terminal beta-propeller domain